MQKNAKDILMSGLKILKHFQEVVMKTKSVKTLVVLTVFAVIIGGSSLGFSHFETDQKQKELSGTISLKLPGGYYLKTSAGDEYRLMLGPPWFLEEIGLDLNNRDRVSVTGYDDGYNVILVTSLTKGTKTYEIFDAETLAEYGGHGCGGRRGGGHHGMWGNGQQGRWDRRGNFNRGWKQQSMMQDDYDYGRKYKS
jgi:hypothetical protein